MQFNHQPVFLSAKSILVTSCITLMTLSGCQTISSVQSNRQPSTSVPTIQTTPKNTSLSTDETPTYNSDEGSRQVAVNDPIAIRIEPAPTVNSVLQPEINDKESVPSYQESIKPPTSTTQLPNNEYLNKKQLNSQPQMGQGIPATNPRPQRPDAKTAQQMLTERARRNSKQPNNIAPTIENGDNIPAFRQLMNTGIKQLKQGQITAAQSTFTRAQRLAPQSSAVYFYLGQVALKQSQPLKAEAMARRGLVVAQSQERKVALWQLILRSGELQGNQRVINEARQALSK